MANLVANNDSLVQKWDGDYKFVIRTLLMKDFRVRYRNMSLGVGWSLANPLVMMSIYWFVFTTFFPNKSQPLYPIFLLCGLVPFSFFTLAWRTATSSLVDNASLIKRTRFPREIVPVTTVLGNCVHFLIQLGILLLAVLVFGRGINIHWIWLPLVVVLEIIFTIGMGLMFAALDVYIRDICYIVESANLMLLWLVPIFYSFQDVPQKYAEIYRFNPLATVVLSFRKILLEGQAPDLVTILKLVFVSTAVFLAGILVFERLKKRFYDYL